MTAPLSPPPAQFNVGMSYEAIRTYIRRRLAPNQLCLELEDVDVDDSITDALLMFAEAMGQMISWQIAGSSGVKSYPIADMTLPDGVDHREVLAVVNIQSLQIPLMGIQSANPEYLFTTYPYNTYLYEFIVSSHHREMRRDTTHRGFEWKWDPRQRTVFVDNSWDGMILGILGVKMYRLEEIPLYYQRRFRECVEGLSRMRLGDVRGKYGGEIPGATHTITVDAEYQRERGKELLDATREWLEQVKQIAPPILG